MSKNELLKGLFLQLPDSPFLDEDQEMTIRIIGCGCIEVQIIDLGSDKGNYPDPFLCPVHAEMSGEYAREEE